MIKVNVISEDSSWNRKIKNKKFFFNQICKNFPRKYRFLSKNVFFTLLLSNNIGVKKLNKKFRNKNKHTDILSFPTNYKSKKKREIYLGDIIISYNYINKPKNLTLLEFKKNLTKIFIHGFLHLIGFDHIKNKDYKIMANEEEKIFKSVSKFFV